MSMVYPHIEERHGTYYIQGSRVPVITIIRAWENGTRTPQAIQHSYSTLSLAEIFAALAFYCDHKDMLDRHFDEVRLQEEANMAQLDAANAEFRAQMRQRFDALKQHGASHSLWI